MRANLDGRIPDGMLARVSSLAEGRAGSLGKLQAFVTELDRASSPALRAVLFGSRKTMQA
jgi:hypothetical protein